MYEDHFKLSKNPFSLSPDPSALFLTAAHREALAGLSYAIIMRKGLTVLVGEAGTGKTTLLRRLVEMLPDKSAQTRVIVNPTLTPSEFLEFLLLTFGVRDLPASKALRLMMVEDLLQRAQKTGKATVLIIDEAHKLSFEVLEEIRLLMNFETSEQKLLQIVLAGQPALNDILNRAELWQFKQRIAIRLQIDPLTHKQVGEYLVHRCTRIGGLDTLPFDEDAISAIFKWSQGIPRLINSICDNALLLAFSSGAHMLNSTHILEAVRDLDVQPATPEPAPGALLVEPRRLEVVREAAAPAATVPLAVKTEGAAQGLKTPATEPPQLETLARYAREESSPFFLRRWTSRRRA